MIKLRFSMKNHKQAISDIVLLSIGLLCIITIFVLDIVNRVKNGWSANDSMNTIFFICILIVACLSIISFSSYFVNSNSEVVFINNEIYRKFHSIKEKNKLDLLAYAFIKEHQQRSLLKINNLISKKYKTLFIDEENIDSIFCESCLKENDSFKFCSYTTRRIEKLYSLYKSEKSTKYEKLFRDVESMKIIEKPKFPLAETITTLGLAVLSVMISFYQSFENLGNITESLFNYCLLLFLTIVFSWLISLLFSKSFLPSYKKDKQKTIEILEKTLNL